MNKKLYIRFFKNKDSIPTCSNSVFYRLPHGNVSTTDWNVIRENVLEWMEKYPDGKIDFVWL